VPGRRDRQADQPEDAERDPGNRPREQSPSGRADQELAELPLHDGLQRSWIRSRMAQPFGVEKPTRPGPDTRRTPQSTLNSFGKSAKFSRLWKFRIACHFGM